MPRKRRKKKTTADSAALTGGRDVTVATNRRAHYNYAILETFDAGLVLKGSEVKSLRHGSVSLREGYVALRGGEAYLMGVHIAAYKPAAINNHEPVRPRKLLLHRSELFKLDRMLSVGGVAAVPLRLHFAGGRAKVEFGVGRGRTRYDKRARIAERDAQRQMQRHLHRPS